MEIKINVDMTALKQRIGMNIKRVEATLASLRDQYDAILAFETSQKQTDLFPMQPDGTGPTAHPIEARKPKDNK